MSGFYIHIAFIISLYAASLIGRMMINDKSTKQRISKVSQFVLGVLNLVIFGGYFLVFFFPGIEKVELATNLGSLQLPFLLRIVLGVLFIGTGIVIYYITVNVLIKRGKGFSAYKYTKNVVNESIYKYIRHPMSVGYYFFAMGFPFLYDSIYLLIITLFGFIPVQAFYVLVYEEKELEYRFKDSYKEYKYKVPRFIPDFTSKGKN